MRPYSGQARAGKAPPRSSGGEPADASNVAFFLPTSVGARGGGGQAAGGGGAGFSDLKFIPLAKGPAPRARGSAALRVTRPASQPRADAADAWDGARAHSPGGGGRRFSSPLVANNREDLQRELQYSLHEALGAATGGSRARGASAGRAQRPHSGSDGAGAWARASVPSTPSAPGTAGRRSGVRTPGGGADATRASLANPYLAARPAAASDRPLEKPVRHKMGGAKAAAPLARAAGAAGKRAAAPAAPAGAARAAPVPTALPSSQLDDALAQLRLFTAGGGGGRDGRDAGAATDARMTDSERVATAARAQAGGRSARTSEGLADGVAEPLRPGVTKHTDQFDLWIAPPTPASGARPPHLAPPAAPTSSASEAGGESAEELRARLAMAEAVMRKLYRRTAQLEERLSTSEAREDGAARPPPSSAAAAAAHGVAAHARRPASAGGGLLSATGTADPAVDADASDAGADGADGGGASRARAALDEHALYLLESHESKAAEMEASLGAMAAHARALEAKLLQSQAVGDEARRRPRALATPARATARPPARNPPPRRRGWPFNACSRRRSRPSARAGELAARGDRSGARRARAALRPVRADEDGAAHAPPLACRRHPRREQGRRRARGCDADLRARGTPRARAARERGARARAQRAALPAGAEAVRHVRAPTRARRARARMLSSSTSSPGEQLPRVTTLSACVRARPPPRRLAQVRGEAAARAEGGRALGPDRRARPP
jgi:hypothetical protein